MQIKPEQIDPDALKVVERLRRYDHTAYLVGGCVRDLLLGRKPKDFDVATSATPNEIRRLFRNCRIIGRRFRLAHIFFGAKIIETSTFRANPRELEEDDADTGTDSEPQDLLIRRDNVFGSAEEDARRRDFTINGLFYEPETGQVIDYVKGMQDLEARMVRTIGDPDIRFREDPVRILRAIKFAARCDLSIEPETYRRMMEHSGEIQKCAQARVSEEFYRLLRAGAAKRSVELLVETGLLDLLLPELAAALRQDDSDEEVRRRRVRFWAYLAALDRSTQRRDAAPTNALVLATLLFPPLRDALHPDSNAVRDVGQLVLASTTPVLDRLRASRRDSELARQILLAMRYLFPSSNPHRKRPRLAGREFLDDALRLHEIISDAEGLEGELAGRPVLVEGAPPPSDELPPELAGGSDLEVRGRDRRGRDRGRRPYGGERERAPMREASTPPGPAWSPSREVRTPIPDISGVRVPPSQPAFMGTGRFGRRWGAATD